MRISKPRMMPIACLALAFLFILSRWSFAAAVETPKGKRIPGQILDEKEKGYKVSTDLPGGGRIIFNVDKDKVDPHGTVPGKGRIEDIKGKAEIKRAGSPRFVSAVKNMTVEPGDEIRTAAGSKVVVTLEKTAVNGIGENTQWTLGTLEVNPENSATQVEINVPQGKLWSEVGKLKTKDSSFQVTTPTAVTGVRGTVFLVEVQKETAETNVAVVSGQVAVGSKGVAAPEIILGKKESLVVRQGEAPQKLSATDLISKFIKILEDWAKQSEYFQGVTALAGIGQVEEIEIEPGLPEAQKQKVYDAIQAGWEKASEDFFQLDKALKMFYLDFGRFPTAEEGGLNALVSSIPSPQWNGPYTESQYLADHYGVSYGYAVSRDIHGNVYVEITTFGYDKKPGTSDDRRKIITEEEARRWEDRKSYR